MHANRGLAAAGLLLRGAGLLAGVLAIIIGILGMHGMSGTHSMHSQAAISGATTVHMVPAASAGAGSHEEHPSPAVSHAHPVSDGQDGFGSPEQCSCSGSCSSTHGITASCTPSAKTGSLSAPLPGTALYGVISNPVPADAATGHWSYRPGSPSPGELSISRT